MQNPRFIQITKAGDLDFNVLSINKLTPLGWTPQISLKEGINQLCQERIQGGKNNEVLRNGFRLWLPVKV